LKTQYDIVIAGFGAAGGQLLHQLILHKVVSSHSVLVIDKLTKTDNDRTWCYWEKGAGLYDDILTHRWEKMAFSWRGETCVKSSMSWRYKQLEANRFYAYVRELSASTGVEFIQAEVLNHLEKDEYVEIQTDQGTYQTKFFFCSIVNFSALRDHYNGPWLYQHFVGWFVRTEKPIFESDVATLMDFDEEHQRTEFMYMLPDSSNTALIEHTLFSEKLLSQEEYESAIQRYLTRLNCGSYEIVRKERGIIPMTDFPFQRMNSKRVIMIGSAGGWTRASTGYTFKNSGILAERVAKNFNAGAIDFEKILCRTRGLFYDRVMLQLLRHRNDLGPQFLFQVYKRNPLDRVFRFLDGNSTFAEEMKIVVKSTPRWELLKAVFRCLIK